MIYRHAPLASIDWPGDRTPPGERRSRYTFKATWSNTLQLLDRELTHLAARDVLIEVAVTSPDIRLDGMLRANTVPCWPGVVITFDSRHGPLTYSTDSCEWWQHNVRSIALGLEALRAVDRYGISRSGQQYRGYRELTTGAPTKAEARATLLRWAGMSAVFSAVADWPAVYRAARAAAHPDRQNGNHDGWYEVDAAARVLGLAS